MNVTKKFKRFTALALLTTLASPALYAHYGHVADSSLHSLLHSEHIVLLAVAAAVSLAAYASRNK
jgi:membrane protein DedA with SNARE-associated domain